MGVCVCALFVCVRVSVLGLTFPTARQAGRDGAGIRHAAPASAAPLARFAHLDPEEAADLEAELVDGSEPERIDASYALGEAGEVGRLLESLRRQTTLKLGLNLERQHTNAAQVDAVYGLTVAGSAAVPALTDLLQDIILSYRCPQ